MPTECGADLFEFPRVEGRRVMAGFDGGAMASDAGALLLGAADRAIRLTERFAACFSVRRVRDAMASAQPWQYEFGLAHALLQNALA